MGECGPGDTVLLGSGTDWTCLHPWPYFPLALALLLALLCGVVWAIKRHRHHCCACLLEEAMAALDTLNANIQELSGKVDQLLTKTAGVPEADVQASADAVAAISAKIPA